MIPVVDNIYAADGQALLTSRYASLKIVPGVVKALMLAIQELETAYWSIINGIQLTAPPVGDAVDKLGLIVGAPARSGLSDAAYLAVIKIWIAINNSHGLANDILRITAMVYTGAVYQEWPSRIAAWDIDLLAGIPAVGVVAALANYLGLAKSAATAGTVRYRADANALVVWGSNVGSVPSAAGFSDSVAGLPANHIAGLQAVN